MARLLPYGAHKFDVLSYRSPCRLQKVPILSDHSSFPGTVPSWWHYKEQRYRINHIRITLTRLHAIDPLITYVWGCVGSSPNVTVSPGMSLKHFWQKVYLSERRPIPFRPLLYRRRACSFIIVNSMYDDQFIPNACPSLSASSSVNFGKCFFYFLYICTFNFFSQLRMHAMANCFGSEFSFKRSVERHRFFFFFSD